MNTSSTIQRLAWILWSPSHTFNDIQEKPTWLGPFFIIGIGMAIIAWISVPFFQNISLIALTESLSGDQLERITRINKAIHYVSTVSVFLIILFYWFISTFVIWLTVQVFEGLVDFKTIFSVVAHANVISLIASILVVVLQLIKVKNNVVDLQMLEIKLGLDLFWETETHPVIRVILMNINPFSLWYYGLLTLGIRIVCKFSWTRSAGMIGIFWILCLAFGSGVAWVLSALNLQTSQT